MTRTRRELTREIVRHTQRIQATLEEANIKVTSVISDILGLSGRRILKAIVGGEGDPSIVAGLRHPRLACPHEELIATLDGRLRDHHRFLIGQHLKTIEQIEATIAEFDARLEVALAPFRDVIERLKGIPGVSDNVAQTLIAEVGADMSAFPTGDNLVSWAGMCPRLDESAGRKRSKRLRKGAPWLKPVLVQAALSATKVKSSSMRARYLSLKPRLGHKKAIIAVAAAMLRAVYHMLKDGTFYQDLGPGYRRPRNPQRAANNLAKRIRALGFVVELKVALTSGPSYEGFGRRPFAGALGLGAGPASESLVRRKPREGRRAVWLGGTYGDFGVADGSPMWRRGWRAAGVIVRSEHDALFRGRGCERRVWAQQRERGCGGREGIAFLLRRARGGEGDKHSEAGSAAIVMRCRS